LDDKNQLRARLKAQRREYVAGLPDATRALLFRRPPSPVADLMPKGSTVGLYCNQGSEAPTRAYAQWFYENGRQICLPWFAERGAPMQFRLWSDPWNEALVEKGPYGVLQPGSDAAEVVPGAVFVPLIGFTFEGDRLGQGGGHYDRWLASHPQCYAVGLAWDCQLVETLPLEEHDGKLSGVVTSTRIYDGSQ
jgi:5-formyltetrahydrofolate cyclo-ligase